MGEHVKPVVAPEWMLQDLDKFLRNQQIAECAAAESRQKRINKFMRDGRKSIDGLGRPKFEIDEYVLAHWRQRLGYNPLKDSGWVKYMEKHHPYLMIKSLGTKEIHVGWQAGLENNIGKKFYHKKY